MRLGGTHFFRRRARPPTRRQTMDSSQASGRDVDWFARRLGYTVTDHWEDRLLYMQVPYPGGEDAACRWAETKTAQVIYQVEFLPVALARYEGHHRRSDDNLREVLAGKRVDAQRFEALARAMGVGPDEVVEGERACDAAAAAPAGPPRWEAEIAWSETRVGRCVRAWVLPPTSQKLRLSLLHGGAGTQLQMFVSAAAGPQALKFAYLLQHFPRQVRAVHPGLASFLADHASTEPDSDGESDGDLYISPARMRELRQQAADRAAERAAEMSESEESALPEQEAASSQDND